MSNFRKGDLVRRVANSFPYCGVSPGDEVIVAEDQFGSTLLLEGQGNVTFTAARFTLVKAAPPVADNAPFALGDKVRRLAGAGTSVNCKPGGEYIVNCVKPDGDGDFDIGVTADEHGPAPLHFARNFELVERAPRTKAAPPKADTPATRAEFAGYQPNIGHTTDGGGLQQHSIGGPFPFVLVGIENPTGLEPGTYWYVQDKAGDRCTIHIKSCERAGKVAAHLSTTYPGGINTRATSKTPPLSNSEGYIKPKSEFVTVKLARADAEAFHPPAGWSINHNKRVAAAIKAAL